MTKQFLTYSLALSLAVVPALAAKPPAKTPDNKRIQLVTLNNKAVAAINAHDFGLAIKNLEAALRLDPNYAKARETLSIAYNNCGIEVVENHSKAIGYFHKSLFFNPNNPETTENLKGILEKSGKSPDSPELRLGMAREANAKGDLVEAIVEYRQAIVLGSKDATVPKELKVAEDKLNARKDPVWKALPPPVDYRGYMEALQRRMKLHWAPPKGTESRRIEVLFKLHSDGRVSHLRLKTPCDIKGANDAALAAVIKSSPFSPLPKGSVPDVDIDFTFDYNVFQNAMLARQADITELSRSIESSEKAFGKDSPKLVPLLIQLAGLYTTDGKYSDSEALLTRALQLEESANGAESNEVAVVAKALGEQYALSGKYNEAEPLLKRALDIREKYLPTNDPAVMSSLEDYAKLLYRTSKFTEANKIYDRLREAKATH